MSTIAHARLLPRTTSVVARLLSCMKFITLHLLLLLLLLWHHVVAVAALEGHHCCVDACERGKVVAIDAGYSQNRGKNIILVSFFNL